MKSEAEKDLEGTLRKVYAAGFRDIEFAGYYGKTPADLAKLMKDIGFSLVSTHAGAGDIAKSGDKIIADAKALGLKYVVCSSPGVSPEKEKLPWEERMKARGSHATGNGTRISSTSSASRWPTPA